MRRLTLMAILVTSICFMALAYSDDKPETITLDGLSNIYGPVDFSHGAHTEIADDCATCHHHSEKGSTPSCQECHEPISIYNYKGAMRTTGLGLKGAYHNQCIGCHKEADSGPLGCTDCHIKKVTK